MYYNLEAIVLKRENWREDDLLITCYTKEKGKLKLQARGAKKIKSKLAGHLEPVSLSILNVTKGKNIDQLIGAQMINCFEEIKGDLVKLGYANWFLEILDRLVGEGEKDERIFELLRKALVYLEKIQDTRYKIQIISKTQDTISKKVPISNFQFPIMRIAFGFKFLDLLGLSPVEKNIKFKNEIGFVVKNRLEDIFGNKEVVRNLKGLHDVLDNEIKEHLNDELRSGRFLGEVVGNL